MAGERLALNLAIKKNKPPSVPVKFLNGDIRSDGQMPINGGLHTIHLPIFTTPQALSGETNNRSDALTIVGFDTMHIGAPNEVLKSNKATGVLTTTRMDIYPFARMLAKIAHSYHIATQGLFPTNESPILEIALNKNLNLINKWIGCTEEAPLFSPNSRALHLLSLDEIIGHNEYLYSVVRMRLLSVNQGPTYAVITRIHNK